MRPGEGEVTITTLSLVNISVLVALTVVLINIDGGDKIGRSHRAAVAGTGGRMSELEPTLLPLHHDHKILAGQSSPASSYHQLGGRDQPGDASHGSYQQEEQRSEETKSVEETGDSRQ